MYTIVPSPELNESLNYIAFGLQVSQISFLHLRFWYHQLNHHHPHQQQHQELASWVVGHSRVQYHHAQHPFDVLQQLLNEQEDHLFSLKALLTAHSCFPQPFSCMLLDHRILKLETSISLV
ncbi:hypothetical protein HanXRQr2_Chr09g0374921 [Helianthus annuus]|uniref:Uncharacterized protein n=1 Tax=Helianthus annuus TaxID=4232 RepID=A0A9K3I3U9_HELAN|nr:hypothetical protein HanXRQr2_Chr09g0374921 [Helianthus annuus]